jgi:hypothetical protein
MTRNADTAGTLALLLPMLGSSHDGEVLATVQAIRKTLVSAGHTFNDLLSLLGAAQCCCSLQEPTIRYTKPAPSTWPEPWTPA